MKKSTKGAIAAAAAGVLLLGGAGTLAYWTDQGTVTGTSLSSGHLTLDETACNAAEWTLDDGPDADTARDPFNPGTDTLIPGDDLQKACDVVVEVEGTHFTQVDIDATTQSTFADADWAEEVTVGATVAGSATGGDNVAVTQGANNIPVVITVTWDYDGPVSDPATTDADNDLNGSAVVGVLDDISVIVVQDHEADAN